MSDAANGLDARMLDLLRENGRMTNIEVARQLDVSEATVRQRLKRMVDSQRIGFKALVDLALIGMNVVAVVRIRTAPGQASVLIDAIVDDNACSYLARATGPYNVVAIFEAEDNRALDEKLRALVTGRPDVQDVDCKVISRAFKFDSRLAPLRGTRDINAKIMPDED